jgi:hypothetical protein
MKNIELTKDHKCKLLEMCKVLFPEIDWKWWTIEGPNGEVEELELLECSTIEQFLTIHWFEFCMTHLAKKLLNPNDLIYYQTTGYFLYEHPIDYFYVKFKQK